MPDTGRPVSNTASTERAEEPSDTSLQHPPCALRRREDVNVTASYRPPAREFQVQPVTNRVAGRWRIVEMDPWDRDAIDLVGPAFIEITTDGHGSFRFTAVEGYVDGRHVEFDGRPAVEFTWDGTDEGDHVSGRGWAQLDEDGSLRGHLFFRRRR